MSYDVSVQTSDDVGYFANKTYSVAGYYLDPFHMITPANNNRDISVSAPDCLFTGGKSL
jgi:hypothetical protein